MHKRSSNCDPSPTLTILTFLALMVAGIPALAQRPQDTWFREFKWDKSSGVGSLSSPRGIAIADDQRIFVADPGTNSIKVYLEDGTFDSEITSPLGNGDILDSPFGMVFDDSGKLYVAAANRNAVYVLETDGTFVRKIGGIIGSGPGELSGVYDVAVSSNGDVFVVEYTNARVSQFSSAGVFLRHIGESGSLTSQLYPGGPVGVAVSKSGLIYVCQRPNSQYGSAISVFNPDGTFRKRWNWRIERRFNSVHAIWLAPACVRVDKSGLVYVLMSYSSHSGGSESYLAVVDNGNFVRIANEEGVILDTYTTKFGNRNTDKTWSPTLGVGPEGSFYVGNYNADDIMVFRRNMREQYVVPRNAIPLPTIVASEQRSNSALIDIDYEVSDIDDAAVHTGLLVFKDGVQTLANCINNLTFVEGTAANVGPATPTNTKHRVTWNSAADWPTTLGDYRVAVLAKDSRQGLLDIHYLDLPAARGIGPLRISRSPLIDSDFMQVWWWLLATGDSGISLSGGTISGVGGTFDGQVLNDQGATSDAGRDYIYDKLGVRVATAEEVQWAREGSGSGAIIQSSPTRSVEGRPKKVNEYGFDTGDWSADAWWVVDTP